MSAPSGEQRRTGAAAQFERAGRCCRINSAAAALTVARTRGVAVPLSWSWSHQPQGRGARERLHPRSAKSIPFTVKVNGLKCPGWWEYSLAAISQTTTHMHGHHEATMGLAGVSLGRELRALALSHTASVRRGTA